MRRLAMMIVLAGIPGGIRAECAPERMLRVVFRDATPGLDPDAFAAKPKTIYRLGNRYGRLEEEPDRENGIHGLVVVNEPDIWMVNLATRTGRHIVDTEDPYRFHASVLGNPDSPEFVQDFEFGCELKYMTERGVQPVSAPIDTRRLESYSVTERDVTLRMAFDPVAKKPVIAALYESGELITFLKYIQYDSDLEPLLDLFDRPSGIQIVDVAHGEASE